MGINYMAQVEVYNPPTEHRSAPSWQAVSRWELQKDYGFSSDFYSISRRLWPADSDDILGEEDTEREIFEGKCHVDGELLVRLEPEDGSRWFLWASELQSHVKRLIEQGCRVRVLLWSI